MLFAFLLYDEIEYNPRDEEPSQIVARVLLWMGAVTHVLLTISKFGEWVARRMELEHVHAQWMILPVGQSVAALVTPVVPLFAADNNNSEGTVFIARFFNSFAVLMWVTLFAISFFKVVTTHTSDSRVRYGVFIWLAAPCVLGLSDFSICVADGIGRECVGRFANYYFIGLFMFLCLLWTVSVCLRSFLYTIPFERLLLTFPSGTGSPTSCFRWLRQMGNVVLDGLLCI